MPLEQNNTSLSIRVELEQALAGLEKLGGFDFVETLIDNLQNLNPQRKARRNIFLSEPSKLEERKELKKRLDIWITLLEEYDQLADIYQACVDKSDATWIHLNTQLAKAIERTRDLEASYRAMELFYKNTESPKLKNIFIINAAPEQLNNPLETKFIDAIQDELVNNYDRLDMRNSYSLLILPGYLGSNKVLFKWARIAHANKVMLITDFLHQESADDVMALFEEANLTGQDLYFSNAMMTCNWLLGRNRFEMLGEEEDLFVSPAAALGGKIYATFLSQATAGKKFGGLSGTETVAFPLKKSEIATLDKIGLIPMVNEYGKVMPFSAKTLYTGDNLGLQTYSLVRLLDYISKCMMDFLNRRAFENFNANTRKDLSSQVVKFLESITGPAKYLESFTLIRFEEDPAQKERIYLDIAVKPFFPAKSFLLQMDGMRGDDGTGWSTEYKQQK